MAKIDDLAGRSALVRAARQLFERSPAGFARAVALCATYNAMHGDPGNPEYAFTLPAFLRAAGLLYYRDRARFDRLLALCEACLSSGDATETLARLDMGPARQARALA